jgi:hypothetical protein
VHQCRTISIAQAERAVRRMGVRRSAAWFDDCVQEYLIGGPNNVLDLLRCERRRIRRIDGGIDPAELPGSAPAPATQADPEWWAAVRRLLTPRQWAAVEMCLIGRFTYCEAARECNCTRDDINNAIRSAKRVLLSHFGNLYPAVRST